MSDTPRTDAKRVLCGYGEEMVNVDFARELECDNAALRAQVDSLQLIANDRDYQSERAAIAEREVARLQMEVDSMCNAEELRQVRAERDALRAELKLMELKVIT